MIEKKSKLALLKIQNNQNKFENCVFLLNHVLMSISETFETRNVLIIKEFYLSTKYWNVHEFFFPLVCYIFFPMCDPKSYF